jgi:hypothetical protein
MAKYTPHAWLVLKFNLPSYSKPLYKVFATWSGGYLDSDSWRLNSRVIKVVEDGDYYLFYGYSGSVYRCHKKDYGVRGTGAFTLKSIEDKYNPEVMPETTDWLGLEF